ncbi:MAG TPA: sulfite exporter TauE/SafE family protein [Casimicrobiaceae bacterium]|nr:sulfite exporter TauE/SafE family protein [Casimicrobiaceae bacterium]
MSLALIPVFLLLGAFVGFLAGLLGIGGGFTMVPVLTEVFQRQGIATSHLLSLAIGTSAAAIVFSAFSSASAHHRRGAVLWPIVTSMAPGLVVGSLIGPQIASALPMRVMAAIFGSFTWFTAIRMVSSKPPKATRELPGRRVMFAVGTGIGLAAGMVGTAGAFLSVPFMTRCNVKVHNAVATSAAIGLPVALASAIGYAFAGWSAPDLPRYSLGYVYLPAIAVIVVMSTLFAPLGARVAHAWPVRRLRKTFSLMLWILGAWMWWKALRH